MLAKIIIENGVKKLVPLTADAGAGNPVGSLLHTYKKSNPSGYLYCDGRDTTGTSEELSTHYPLLYAYLGTNVLPDYRECVEVGAEQNATDAIATHDVYTEGQFKDDQLQDHVHGTPFSDPQGSGGAGWVTQQTNINALQDTYTTKNTRAGTTTHGKQKAVFVYIKATSGLSENAQDNVINTLNEERSYSTSEVNTGKKWIDGKPIYRKVMPILSTVVHDEWSLAGYQNASALFGSNVDILVNTLVIGGLFMPTIADKAQGLFTRGFDVDTGYIVLEYTKTN